MEGIFTMGVCITPFLHSLCLALILNVVSSEFCSKGQSVDGDPTLPDLNFNAFTVNVMATILDDNKRPYTMLAKEYYDYNLNVVRVTMNTNGEESGIIMDYANNIWSEYFIDDTKSICTVKALDQTAGDNFDVFGGSYLVNGKPHIFTSQGVLRMNKELGESYKGRVYIDDVLADHWQSCMYWPDDRDNFTVDYFFTPPHWGVVHGQGPSQLPLRMEIKGIKTTADGQVKLHHVYEYVDFKVLDRLRVTSLALPEGLGCQDPDGLRNKPFPEGVVSPNMYYSMEVYSKTGGVHMVEVLYSYDFKIASVWERTSKLMFDFTTGVSYTIDSVNQLCSVDRLTSNVRDFLFRKDDKGLIRMATPKEVFFLDRTFTYRGLVERNGVPCDAWTGAATIDKQDMKYDVYVLTPQWNSTSLLGSQPLVSMTAKNAQGTLIYNIFGWSSSVIMPVNPLDISLCRTENQTRDFRVVFKKTAGFGLEHLFIGLNANNLKWNLTMLIGYAAGVSPYRLTWSEVILSSQKDSVYWMGKLFDPDPEAKRSADVKDAKAPVSVRAAWSMLQTNIQRGIVVLKTGTINTVTLTAVSLLNFDDDLGSGRYAITPMTYFNKYGNTGVRNVPATLTMGSSSLENCAKSCLEYRATECSAFMMTNTKSCSIYSKTTFTEGYLSKSTQSDVYIRDYKNHFEKSPGIFRPPLSTAVYKNVANVSMCAKKCLLQKDNFCVSFDVCPQQNSANVCYLLSSRTHQTNASHATEQPTCEHYTKHSMLDYTITPKVAVTGENGMRVLSVQNATVCADQCSYQQGCFHFSYCDAQRQCILTTVLKSDMPATKPSDDCALYSSKNPNKRVQSSMLDSGSSDTSHSTGDMAAVAVPMLLVSCLIVLGIAYALAKKSVWNGFNLKI